MAERLTYLHFRIARTALELELRQAPTVLGVPRGTLINIENPRKRVKFETEVRVREAYEDRGVQFLNEAGKIGVLFDPAKKNQRDSEDQPLGGA